jgi:glutamyl-tRNA synthetase
MALFNYIYAKHFGGSFILRVEDTDQARSRDEFVQNLYQGKVILPLTASSKTHSPERGTLSLIT